MCLATPEASLRHEWLRDITERSERSLTTERLSEKSESSLTEDALLASLTGGGLGAAAASEELSPSALDLGAAADLLTAPQKNACAVFFPGRFSILS